MSSFLRPRHSPVMIWVVACFLVLGVFAFQGRIGLNLADEGYLWYGAWRVPLGEVPGVDFRAYEPLRNYWVAFWALVFGDGPVGMRAGVAVAQALGLGCGLLVVRRFWRGWLLLPAGLLLVVWMYPRHKYFDVAVSMAAVWAILRVLEKPDGRRVFGCGVFVGVASTVRINHALYTLLAATAGLLLARRPPTVRSLLRDSARFTAGIAVGLFPLWVLFAFSPESFGTYWDLAASIVRRGTTNHPLPIPWPWRIGLEGLEPPMVVHRLGLGVAFLGLIAFPPLALGIAWRSRREPTPRTKVLLAAALVAVPYTHVALVRSDLSHLCQAAAPHLLGTLALLSLLHRRNRTATAFAWVLLLILTALVPVFAQPGVIRWRYPDAHVEKEVAGDVLRITRARAAHLEAIQHLLDTRATPDDLVFFAPHTPGLYRIFEKPVPVWDPYPILRPREKAALRMIADIRRPHVRWAIVGSTAISGDRFWDTHPRIWDEIQRSFHRIEAEGFGSTTFVFQKNAPETDP